MVPFLKWAGGKRWLTPRLAELQISPTGRYFEPFLGSGAFYFSAYPERAILSDLNSQLIDTYKAIRARPDLILRYLREHHRLHSKAYYYAVRASTPRSDVKKAARFIYLNRTCWNALYRVNKSGKFNVPIGTKTNVLLDTDDFFEIASMLQSAELIAGDFEHVIARAGRDDFLFIDPPYTVKHNLNGFVKYNEKIFNWRDQERLKNAICLAADRGAKVLMTNANHECVKELYRDYFSLSAIERSSVIAASSRYRSNTSELLITNIEDANLGSVVNCTI